MRPVSQTSINKHAYIPPQIAHEMNRQLQQNLPAHLKQYVGSDRPAYIPSHIEQQINQQMQKTMPQHLKQYSGAYMQQNVIQPNVRPMSTNTLASRPPIPNLRKLDHSIPVGEQQNVRWADLSNPTTMPSPASLSFQGQQNQAGEQPGYGQAYPAQSTGGQASHNPYDFIVNPQAPKRSGNLFGGSNAFMIRLISIVGGVVVLLIAGAVLLSALSPKSITPGLSAIAERQQEIIRISTDASTKASSEDVKDFAITTELTVTSSQQQTLDYLTSHKVKLSPKTLALDADTTTDTTLANAQSAGTYDSAVVQNLSSQLQTYEGLLQSTFKETTSQPAKQLLQSDFSTADKLLKQAKSLSSTGFGG